ncbi:hypothetical protein BZL39_K05070 [Zygosaccharomyces parabailii]|nr:hypothetical protein BZL39_K05070 [Zygosaccharomyces parabailii]
MTYTLKNFFREIFIDPWGRLKYGFLPVRRIVDECGDDSLGSNDEFDQNCNTTEADASNELVKVDTDIIVQKEKNITNSENISEDARDVTNDQEALTFGNVEYRDEANKPWWKFFDEEEYRIPRKGARKNHWYSWFNGSPSMQEKKLILKLDVLLAFYSCVAYWVKYLDTVNVNNAYVSGMKEDLGMKGNDLVDLQNMWNIGNIIFQLPFIFVLNKIPLNYLLPCLDIGWSLLTVGQGYVKTYGGMKALRFFVGAFEAPSYLAYQYLFGCFYKHDEMVRRSAFYYFGQYIGSLSSGGIQAGVYGTLSGKNGLSGWRWNFVIDAIVSAVVGVIGFYSLPGDPRNCYSIFLTDDEIRLARKRLQEERTQENDFHHKIFDLTALKGILLDWKIWVLSVWAVFCWDDSNAGSGSYILWLDSLKNSEGEKRYSVEKVNQLSMITPGLGLVYLALAALVADKLHSRWLAICVTQIFNIIGNVILSVWYVAEGAKWFAFMLQYMGYAMAPVLYGWVNDICRRDSEARAVIIVTLNIAGTVFNTWSSVVFFPTVEAPRYLKGYAFTAANAFALVIWTFVVLWLAKRDDRKHSAESGIILYNSKKRGLPEEKPDTNSVTSMKVSGSITIEPGKSEELDAGLSEQ